ncbi:secreted acid phosphatase [Cryptosporidium ubiquitum]|uniref:acid phosphatase n=1 Tax=Cryptosporidium ubiquitum TaxID=857276 RepID=A0A1J4MPU1_9CRYT|nr:secreted acid phosphatase [Cryptosporidium ubiquitum]OII75004.1 secreted acid phosphatase [Cryptosporidium ubiquitum]
MSKLNKILLRVTLICLSVAIGCSSEPLSWMTFGDWGEPTAILSAVSRSMANLASVIKPKFIISVGDNFYRWGVSSVDDPIWENMFESVFDYESLQDIQFRCVLGNHDWWGNATAQIDRHYSTKSPRWYLPNFWYYTIEEFDSPRSSPHPYLNVSSSSMEGLEEMVKTKAIFIYTDSWVMSSPMGSDITPAFWEEQMVFIENTLKAAVMRDIDWIFIIGHYPCYSSGEHGDNADVHKILDPLLKKYKVDAYIAGHDHHLELSRPKGSCTSHFLIGSACCPKKHDYFNNKHRIFRTGRGGFASHKLTYSQLHSTYHNIEGKPIFTTTQKRLNRKKIKDKLIKEAMAKIDGNSFSITKNKPKEQDETVMNFVENKEGELEVLDEIENEREQEAIENVQNSLDQQDLHDRTDGDENEDENGNLSFSKRKFPRTLIKESLSPTSSNPQIESGEVILSPIDESSKHFTLVDAIISPKKSQENIQSNSPVSTVNDYLLQIYDLPPPSKRSFIDEMPTRDKFFGIKFPFGARLMRFRIDRKTSGHPRHEYKYAPILKHSVGVEGSDVTKFSVFQTIAWNELENKMKSNYKIPDSTWKMMKSPKWKGNFIPWRFVESCTNIIRTMSIEGLFKHRVSLWGIPLSNYKVTNKDIGAVKARQYCLDVANKLSIHRLLQGSVSTKLLYWDRCPGSEPGPNGNSDSDLKTIVALSVIGSARDNCLYPEGVKPKNSSLDTVSSGFYKLLRKMKMITKASIDPDIVAGIDLTRVIMIPMDVACDIAAQLIDHDLNIVSSLEDLVYDRPDEAIKQCSQIVSRIATFIPIEEAEKLCSNFSSYELVGP